VGKTLTQNFSDGLRSVVTATAGLSMMAYVTVKLTGIMMLIVPTLGIGAFFYGRFIRSLSLSIQKALGSLTRVSEERLSSIRTLQAFSGEILETRRYTERVKEIFRLGKTEALANATFFSLVGSRNAHYLTV